MARGSRASQSEFVCIARLERPTKEIGRLPCLSCPQVAAHTCEQRPLVPRPLPRVGRIASGFLETNDPVFVRYSIWRRTLASGCRWSQGHCHTLTGTGLLRSGIRRLGCDQNKACVGRKLSGCTDLAARAKEGGGGADGVAWHRARRWRGCCGSTGWDTSRTGWPRSFPPWECLRWR